MRTSLAFVIPVLVGILLTSALACNSATPDPMLTMAQVELDSHRDLWGQTGSQDYTYEYSVLCECSDNFGQAVTASVANGEIESVVYTKSGEYGITAGAPPSVSGSPRYHTIDNLFGVIQDAITNEVEQLTVSYDSKYGYPRKIDIDHQINAIDDEYVVTAGAYSPG